MMTVVPNGRAGPTGLGSHSRPVMVSHQTWNSMEHGKRAFLVEQGRDGKSIRLRVCGVSPLSPRARSIFPLLPLLLLLLLLPLFSPSPFNSAFEGSQIVASIDCYTRVEPLLTSLSIEVHAPSLYHPRSGSRSSRFS